MPVGPSHGSSSGGRSGGGGGFSFGGGRSGGGGFGGFSFGSSSSSRSSRHSSYDDHNHYRRRHRGPRSFRFGGRTVIISTGRQSAISVLLMFMVFAIFSTFIFNSFRKSAVDNVKVYTESIAQIEQDASWYQNTITEAKKGNETDNYYLAEATFRNSLSFFTYSDAFFNPASPQIGIYEARLDCSTIPYYYLVYEYTNEVTGQKEYGWTYTQFSQSQLPSGKTIEIAYAKDGEVYFSINTSYTLEANQDYKEAKYDLENAKSNKGTMTLIMVVSLLFALTFVGILVLVFVSAIKKAKREQDTETAKQEAEIKEAEAKAEEAERVAKQKGRVCTYCGASVPDGADACPSCGSRKFN